MTRKRIILRGLLRFLVIALCTGFAGVNLYLFNAAKLTGDPAPMPFGVGISVVLSGSMEPTLSTGDLIIAVEQDNYKAGDVVVFRDGNIAVVHRIINIEGGTVTTRGDANNIADEPFPLENVKGRVVASIPLLGYAMNFLKTPAGVLLLLAMAVLLTELNFRQDRREKTDEIERIKAEIRELQAAGIGKGAPGNDSQDKN